MHTVDLNKLFGSLPLFQQVAAATVQSMARHLTRERWRKATKVISTGDAAERCFVIVRGRVKISRFDEHTGRELTLLLLGPGDVFNVASLLDGQGELVTARTLEEVAALSAPMATWRKWMEEDPQLRRAVDRYAAQQIRALMALAAEVSLQSTMCRLARLLLRQVEQMEQGCSRVDVSDLSHEELACLIGSARVVVTRLLARLKQEGIIDTRGRSIRILNAERLRHYAQGANSVHGDWPELMVL